MDKWDAGFVLGVFALFTVVAVVFYGLTFSSPTTMNVTYLNHPDSSTIWVVGLNYQNYTIGPSYDTSGNGVSLQYGQYDNLYGLTEGGCALVTWNTFHWSFYQIKSVSCPNSPFSIYLP